MCARRLSRLLMLLPTSLLPTLSYAGAPLQNTSIAVSTPSAIWSSAKVEHAYGVPEVKKNEKGTLTLTADVLIFSSKSSNNSISRSTITAVNSSNERIELWGTGGRILRLAMQNGTGQLAALFLHHRVDMLTVEFRDARGGFHAAVFYLPAKEAAPALAAFSQQPFTALADAKNVCPGNPVEPRSVLVEAPNWDLTQVPAAYRALVYEHLIHRLDNAKNMGRVYRDGDMGLASTCPQYTIKMAVETFKQGNQVARATLGPAGMLTSPTQLKLAVHFIDASAYSDTQEQIKAAVRTDSESSSVADAAAKNLTKHFLAITQTAASKTSTDSQKTP